MANIKLNIITATNMQGLIQLENKLKDIKQIAQSADNSMIGTYSAVEIQKTINAVNTLQHALRAAYDTKLNTVNIEKFNQYLAKSKMSVQDLYINLSRMGATGRQAFMDMTQTSLMMGRSVKQTNDLVTQMQQTMKNTVTWGISSGLWNNILSSVSKAWTYVKGLNSDLNDIRIVTGKSADQMERFAKTANKTAKELAVSTRDYTQGALLYYQQGDNEETVETKTNITAKASNVTGQDMATVSEQLTAVWNGYQVANQAAEEGMQVYEEYVDKLAAVAATTASDLEEQATAMSKVASAAHTLGVGFDDLNAQIATIESVTRQAPESVGTALKTIYARLGDLKVDGVDEFGVTLGEVSSQLAIMGVDILDTNGDMKDMSTIMEDIANKWQLWTSAQKQAAAIAMAGKRQYNNLFALFENQDMYNKALNTSMEASGTLAEQQAIAVEDLDSKLQKLATSTEKVYDALFNEESIGGLIDAFTVVVDLIGSAVQGIGGLEVLIPAVGGKLLKSFGADIGNTVAKKVENKRVRERELKNDDAKLQLATQLGESGQYLKEDEGKQDSLMSKEQKVVTDYYKDMYRFRKNMTDEEIQAYNVAMKHRAEVANIKLELQETVDSLKEQNKLTEEQYNIISKINKGEEITEEEKQELENLKEKIKLQRMFVEQTNATVITENLGKKGVSSGIEARRNTIARNLEKGKKTIANNIIQRMQDDGTIETENIEASQQAIENMLEKAIKKGYSTKEALKNIQAQLVEINGYEYSGSYFTEIEGFLKNTEQDIEEFSKNTENNFDEHIGKQLQQAFGPKSQAIIDELKNKIVNLVNKGKTFEEAYVEAMAEIKKEAENTGKTLQGIDISNIDLDNADFEMKGLLETQELKTAMEGLSSAVGGVMQVFAGLSGVMNSFKSAMDPSLDSTERLSAAFTGLITSGFIIVSAINSITQATKSLKEATHSQTAAEALRKVVMTVIGKLSKQNAQNTADETKQIRNKTAAIHENTAALVENEAVEQATQNAMSETGTGVESADGAIIKMSNSAKNAGGNIAGLSKAAVVATAALVAVVAAVATAVIIINEHQTSLERATAASRNYEKAAKELANEAKNEKEAIDNITSAYKDLVQQYDDSSISLDELQVKTSDLCIQYGQQELALQSLIAGYKELNDIMDEAQNKANQNYIEKTKVAVDATKARIVNEIAEKGTSWITDEKNGRATLDVTDGLIANSSEKELHSFLEEYGVKVSEGHIYTDDLVDALSKNYDEIIKGLGEINGNAAKELLNTINIVSDDLKEVKDTQETIAETDKTVIAKEYQNKQYNSYQEYKQAINEMTNKAAKYFNTKEEAQAWAENQLVQDNPRFSKINILAKKQAEKNGTEVTEEIIKNLEKLNDEELNFAFQYFDMKAVDENFKEFANKYANFIDYLNKENQIVPTIELVLNNKEAKEITQEELDSLFSSSDFEKVMNISKEQFEALDFEEQRLLMSQYYLDYQKYITENKDAIVESIQETADELNNIEIDFEGHDKEWITTVGNVDYLKENYSEELKDIIEEGFTYKQIAEVIEKYATEGLEGLSESELNIFKKLQKIGVGGGEATVKYVAKNIATDTELTTEEKESRLKEKYGKELDPILEEHGKTYSDLVSLLQDSANGEYLTEESQKIVDEVSEATNEYSNQVFSEDFLKNYGTALHLNKKYEEQVKLTTEALAKAKNGQADYSEALKAARGQYVYVNEGIDNIQDGLSQLTSITEDFNDNGTLSLDSLQTLLTMSEDMLACLEVENGQMKINKDKVKEMTLARLDEARATIMMETQSGLLDILNRKVAESENEATHQAILRAETVTKGAEAAKASADEWLRYNAIVGEVDLSEIYNSQEAQDFLENQRKKMLGLESSIEGLKNMDMTIISGDERDEELKKLDEEFDRYWDLNNAIDATSKALEDLSETQDKLTRGELQNSLREQNKLLEQQIINYKNLRKEQEKEAGELKSKLLTFGVDFNADGSIANYAEVTQKALNYYNNVAQRYNKGIVSDKGLENAEKSYEKFKEALERYDSLYYDEMVETAENIADIQREILENNLQDFELSITIKTDAAEFDREIKDFETEIAKDFTKAFEDIDSTIKKSQFNVESYGESFNAVAAGISKVEEEILKLHKGENSYMFSSITEAQEKLKELNEEAMEHASNMKAAYEEAWEAYLEGIDQSQEKFDDLQEKYSKINEELEYQKELIELIYGPKAYDLMDKFYEKQKENSLSQIKSLQYEKELWLSKYDAEAAKAGNEDQLKIAERISQIQSDLNNNVTSYIQLLKDEYANTINGILSNFESQLTNGSSFDDIAEEWERLAENSDKYFNNVEGLYETQTLANKIKDSINDTISVKNQEKLQALYNKEIEYLREKENLTQYDLDAAEARYQIALKEIALEEARANKNSMRLTRDASGNWSYQYVADENNIAEKQQELSDAMYKFYELSDKAYKENLESIQKLNQEYFDKAEEIATNELLTEQEKELKLEELRKWYLNQYQLLVSENEIIRQNLANGTVGVLNNLYNQDVENFKNMTLQEQDALTQVKELGISSFAELEDKARQNIEGIGNSINIVAEQNIPEMTSKTQELADTWGADDGASVKAQSLDALNSIIDTSKQYRDSLDEISAAIKEDWGPEGVAGAIDEVSQSVKDVEEATKKLCIDTEKNLINYQTTVNNLAKKWNSVKNAIKDSIKQLNILYTLQGNPPPKVNTNGGAGMPGSGSGFADITDTFIRGENKESNNPLNDRYSIVGYLLGADLQASPGGSRKYDLDNGKEYGVKAYDYVNYGDHSSALYPIRVKLADGREGYVAPGSLYSLRWGNNGVPYRDKLVNTFGKVGSFDTGGYTGEWGAEGRMAMLHEKELILNKEDTKNILAAVNSIRQFSSVESAITRGIASMIMNMAGMGVNANYNTNEAKGNQTEQVFNITAEFPNANNVSEIREAILSLPGLASQQVGLNLI